MLDFMGTWTRQLPLVEFAYNNDYQASIGMAPYEALYLKSRGKTKFRSRNHTENNREDRDHSRQNESSSESLEELCR